MELGADLLTTIVVAKAAKLVADAIKGASGVANEGIYIVRTQVGTYLGQSGKIATRLAQHVAEGKFTQAEVDAAKRIAVPGGKTAREIADQLKIDELGGVDNSPQQGESHRAPTIRTDAGRVHTVTFTLEQTPEGVDLVVTGAWSSEAAGCLVSGEADGLVLNYARGYREKDLSFVKGLPIRRLHLLARTVTDLTPIYASAELLESLRVQSDPRATIELERLPLLRTLSADWQQVHGSIRFAPQLERLFLLGYSEPDFGVLSSLTALVSVVLKDYPLVRSLAGVEDLPWLATLGVYLAKNLEDITALERTALPTLQVLQLPSCRKVADIDAVAACPSLRFFELSDGGEIPTVAPLAGLDHLERLYLYGSTKIADADLGPIARLPRLSDFRIQSRRRYSPPVKEIQDAIARRG